MEKENTEKNYLREFNISITYSLFPEEGVQQENHTVKAINKMCAIQQGEEIALGKSVISDDMECWISGDVIESEYSFEYTVKCLARETLKYIKSINWPLADELTEDEAVAAAKKIVDFGDAGFEDYGLVILKRMTYSEIIKARGIDEGDLKFPDIDNLY